jgi:hypothetical protein
MPIVRKIIAVNFETPDGECHSGTLQFSTSWHGMPDGPELDQALEGALASLEKSHGVQLLNVARQEMVAIEIDVARARRTTGCPGTGGSGEVAVARANDVVTPLAS